MTPIRRKGSRDVLWALCTDQAAVAAACGWHLPCGSWQASVRGEPYVAVGDDSQSADRLGRILRRECANAPCRPMTARDVVLTSKVVDEPCAHQRLGQSGDQADHRPWNTGATVEKWSYPDDGYGDCEDYVLLKRRMLIEAGWPRSALLITVVRDRKGDGHAVLTVRTDKGEYILDNQNDKILPWSDTGYRFVKRQSQSDPNTWVALGDPRPTTATASAR